MEYNKLNKDAFEIIMNKINDLEKLQQENKKHIIKLNTKINEIGMIIMLNNVFNDIEDNAE